VLGTKWLLISFHLLPLTHDWQIIMLAKRFDADIDGAAVRLAVAI